MFSVNIVVVSLWILHRKALQVSQFQSIKCILNVKKKCLHSATTRATDAPWRSNTGWWPTVGPLCRGPDLTWRPPLLLLPLLSPQSFVSSVLTHVVLVAICWNDWCVHDSWWGNDLLLVMKVLSKRFEIDHKYNNRTSGVKMIQHRNKVLTWMLPRQMNFMVEIVCAVAYTDENIANKSARSYFPWFRQWNAL